MRPAFKNVISALALAGMMLGITAGLDAAPRTTPARPGGTTARSSSAGVLKIEGVEYVEADEFGKKLGLKAAWIKAGERLALKSETMRIELQADSREVEVNGLRVFMGEGARLRKRELYISKIDAERLIRPLVRPGLGAAPAPALRVIALDPGHGGKDPGKENARLRVNEKTFTLDVCVRLEKLLTQRGYKVVLTRNRDVSLELGERAETATRAGADLFVSIHFNAVASDVARVSGSETYTMTPQYQRSTIDNEREAIDAIANPGNANDPWNILLGYHVQRSLLADLKTFDRGLKRARFAVLRLATCPAVLVEAGYLSNDVETKKIATSAYRQQIAEAIADGIKAYAAVVASARR